MQPFDHRVWFVEQLSPPLTSSSYSMEHTPGNAGRKGAGGRAAGWGGARAGGRAALSRGADCVAAATAGLGPRPLPRERLTGSRVRPRRLCAASACLAGDGTLASVGSGYNDSSTNLGLTSVQTSDLSPRAFSVSHCAHYRQAPRVAANTHLETGACVPGSSPSHGPTDYCPNGHRSLKGRSYPCCFYTRLC